HSEMPKQDHGLMWGFQLWVNLPARHKMCEPRYQDIPPDRIPEASVGGARVRVVTGRAAGVTGPIEGIATRPLHLRVPPHAAASEMAVAEGHAVLAYVFQGAVEFGAEGSAKRIETGQLAVLEEGDRVAARSEGGGRFLLLAAQPLGEPVARYGPFVMNTREE